jgi:hypothetical protein
MSENNTNGNGVAPARGKQGRFLPGHSYAKGRRGARNLLSESFLRDLHKQWLKSGKAVLEKVAAEEPATLLKIVANVLPRLIDIDAALNVQVQNKFAVEIRDFAQAYKLIGSRAPELIESRPAEEHDEEYD